MSLALLLPLLQLLSVVHAQDLVVRTAAGQVRGHLVSSSRSGEKFMTFAGIPYAKPPIKELRFMPPEPAETWEGVREAKEHGPLCPQVNIYFNHPPAGEEDCLYLSVFTRKLDGKAPVMVHLHGGAWILGDGPRGKNPDYLMDSDIVIVDFNFRIGILGFLSLEDSVLPGNMGLKDQVMALRWVKENIQHFGGDPDRVTLMGECTGADAVYHHMLSPLSAGLFHRGIAESGSSYTAQAVTPAGLARQRALKVGDLMGCKDGGSKELVACLQKKDALELAAKLTAFIEWQIDPDLSFGPVFEPNSPDAFLTGPMSKWTPPKVPLLTGITSGEGLLRTMYFTHDFDFKMFDGDGFNSLIPGSLMIKDSTSNPTEVMMKIRDYYLLGKTITMNDFQNLTNMFGDGWFSYGVLEGAKFSQGDVYMYYFDYMGEITMSQFFGDKTKAIGAFHTDETLYLWQMPGLPQWEGKSLQISKDLIKMWTNFIKTGNPTPTDELGFLWTPYKSDENYLAIREGGYAMEKGLLTDRYAFWKSLNYRDKLM